MVRLGQPLMVVANIGLPNLLKRHGSYKAFEKVNDQVTNATGKQ